MNVPPVVWPTTADELDRWVGTVAQHPLWERVSDAAEREAMRGWGFQAMLVLPVMTGGRVFGFIAFASLATANWPISAMPTRQAMQKPVQTMRRGPSGRTALITISATATAMPST